MYIDRFVYYREVICVMQVCNFFFFCRLFVYILLKFYVFSSFLFSKVLLKFCVMVWSPSFFYIVNLQRKWQDFAEIFNKMYRFCRHYLNFSLACVGYLCRFTKILCIFLLQRLYGDFAFFFLQTCNTKNIGKFYEISTNAVKSL